MLNTNIMLHIILHIFGMGETWTNKHSYITEESGDHGQDYKPWSRSFQVINKKAYKLLSSRFERVGVI